MTWPGERYEQELKSFFSLQHYKSHELALWVNKVTAHSSSLQPATPHFNTTRLRQNTAFPFNSPAMGHALTYDSVTAVWRCRTAQEELDPFARMISGQVWQSQSHSWQERNNTAGAQGEDRNCDSAVWSVSLNSDWHHLQGPNLLLLLLLLLLFLLLLWQ